MKYLYHHSITHRYIETIRSYQIKNSNYNKISREPHNSAEKNKLIDT